MARRRYTRRRRGGQIERTLSQKQAALTMLGRANSVEAFPVTEGTATGLPTYPEARAKVEREAERRKLGLKRLVSSRSLDMDGMGRRTRRRRRRV